MFKTALYLSKTSNDESVGPEKPWLLWLAFGACHAPHHVPKEWLEKYKGRDWGMSMAQYGSSCVRLTR
jgi:arylsulfatase A-like enzyme